MRVSGQRVEADTKAAANCSIQECLILTVSPIEHPTVKQPLDSMTFTSKHSLDMRFTDCDAQWVISIWHTCFSKLIFKIPFRFEVLFREILEFYLVWTWLNVEYPDQMFY